MSNWENLFNIIKKKNYFLELGRFWDEEYSKYTIYPKRELIFNAFNLCKEEDVKVVIIGQDPYHEPGQAMGLAFSVIDGVRLPPSLENIYREIETEFHTFLNHGSGDLTFLAEQGVLLINAYLTVREHEPLSHKSKNYEELLGDILTYLDNLNRPIVFLLWGGFAQKYEKFLKNDTHLILKANHPSPLSANRGGWFGCNNFKLCNKYLIDNGLKPIEWSNLR